MTTQPNIVCDPSSSNNTHHIKLSDGTNQLGFILKRGNEPDPRAITRRPRQQGQYSPFTQSDWGGGRGIKDAQSDRSRYADGKRVVTRHNGSVMLGGQETFTTGYRQQEQYMPGKVTWQSLLTTNRYIAYQVTASATGNRSAIYMWIRRRGTPTSTLTVELCANDTDKPGSVLKTATVTTSTITDTISQLYEFLFSSVQAVTATTVYWVKIYTSTADTATDYWQVGTDAADTNNLTKASSDDSAWSAAAYDLYFRLVDDTDQLGGLFFAYKGQLYFVTRPSGAAAPKLYMNGYRGVATGTHSTTTLQDTTQTFVADELIGSTLLIFSGTNSEWQTPYRTITDNDTNSVTFSPAFPKAPVSADTVYVVLGSNKWTEVAGHGLTVLPTSVASMGEVCYFAQGDAVKMRRMYECLSGTAWTRSFSEENNYAKFIMDYRSSTQGLVIAKVNDSDNSGRPSFAQTPFETFEKRLKFPLLITNCEATTGWTAGAGVTITAETATFMQGNKSIKVALPVGTPPSPCAYYTFTSMNVAKHKQLRFWLKCSSEAQVLTVFFSTSATANSTIQDLTVPAVPSGEWTQVTIPYTDTAANLHIVQSLGFRASVQVNFWVDGIEVVPVGETPLGNNGEKITGMERYGDPEVPWVFRTQSSGSVENGVFNPIPLREMSQAENVHNGAGHVVSNVYLYFSFLHGLERFYRNNLDDVGPNRDEGLPEDRRGFITSMQGYPGRFFYNYDCLEGYSAIFESTSGTDHHEIYRCDTPGKRIRNIFVQVVPGDTADRLWFTEGDDIAWLPLPGNTLKEDTDDTYRFTHEGVLETGWIYGNEQDAVKLFHSLKLFLENTTANRSVEWDYKKNDETAWTVVSTSFSSAPVQEVSLRISARRIKFRFRIQTNDNTETPQIRGMVVDATTRPETRYTYTFTTLFMDDPIDLLGNADTTITAEAVITQLDTWMENNTPLTLSAQFSSLHNKTVFLEPVVLTPVYLIPDGSKEGISGTLNLIEQ